MRRSPSRTDPAPPWLTLFLMVLRHRPRQALDVAYCWLRGRRVRARNRLYAAGATLPDSYRFWIKAIERPEVAALARTAAERMGAPTISVVVDAAAWTDHTTLAATLRSIRTQSDPGLQLIVVGGAGAAREGDVHLAGDVQHALAAADGGFTIIMPPDALLPPWAIARYRHAALAHPDATILFGDEDAIDATGRRQRPWWKPQWNAELILASDYLSHACAIATPALRRAAGRVPAGTPDLRYALVLAAAAEAGAVIRHIPHILCHLPLSAPTTGPEDRARVVADHLAGAQATAAVGPFGTVRVRWPLPVTVPSVTIIVPTRDRVELMEACVGSLLRETDYADYDVLIVDNGSVEPETHAWFAAVTTADARVSVLPYDRPYNYSAINNFAAGQARGQYLCLLNNDTEVIDGAWLSELMRYAVRPGVGAVGAKLLYPDRSIQHAGVVMGMGNAAGHPHRMLPDDQPGYFALAHAPHEASAVTAACLVVERTKFAAVGGLDADHLQIAYNDVDFCLKLVQAGWRNIYAPQAVLIHHESKSRGQDLSPQHIERYTRELATLQERWDTTRVIDRMHHPRLDRASETYLMHFRGLS
ncbi:hypothetical protein ASE86_14795 [Sphingomonas sp. Leaf33]|uniref:glycosyltransferase family 2 protein n=1 Tax=Sphingomonas sp. Leaf33 TaxID=1736215 RepID=UPI0006F5B655|nr:glycosyltransferase family 2 protein [Sphingomonas sp. Leaf33]KQN21238.1 hypothetical protein ASE86_14795 [Sphingomonas sp. Leaf33]